MKRELSGHPRLRLPTLLTLLLCRAVRSSWGEFLGMTLNLIWCCVSISRALGEYGILLYCLVQSAGFVEYAGRVTYWPSTELSIKRCTCVNNWCIRLKILGYHLDLWMGWVRCNCDTHRKQVGIKQLYNQVPQTAWVSWSQSVGVQVAVRSSES